jgi:hypothetical protein
MEVVDATPAPEPVVRRYDQKRYNKSFAEKHPDRIHAKNVCEVCCGTFTYYNKSKHLKTRRHIAMVAKLTPPDPAPPTSSA